MDWENLRLALVLHRKKSLSGAARTLKVSHTTVARRLQRLEASLDVQLFEKHPDGYTTTEMGLVLIATAEVMEASTDALVRQMRGQDRDLEGALSISVPGLLLQPWLLRHLTGFKEKYPTIALSVVCAPDLTSLARQEMDVAIRLTRSPPPYAFGSRVHTMTSGIYASRAYLNAHPDRADWIWVGFEPVSEDNDEESRKRWFPELPVGWRFNDGALIFEALVQGLGIGRTLSILGDLDDWLVRIPGIPHVEVTDLWLLTHQDLRGATRVRAFMDYMRTAIQEDVECCALLHR